MKLFLKGERCYTEKCAIEKRNFPPGQHGKTRKRSCRLRRAAAREAEGQAHLRRARGSVPPLLRAAERDARHHRRDAAAAARAPLDNVVYRLGLSTSRPQARQLVRHGHFLVNGKKVDIPSYSVQQGDVVTVLGRTQKNPTIEHAIEEVKGRGIPEWLSFDVDTIRPVVSMPTREQINLPVQEQLIVELYSK
jgi:small subunit ribosomal protein S4